jgi:glucose-1-phosphate thymidylyltransferase
VYDRPVIYYAIQKLVDAGIHQIMIVTSGHHVADFVKLLGSGHNFLSKEGTQAQIAYGIQNQPDGIARGLHIARDYVGNEDCLLYLGDNIFEDDIARHIQSFKGGARVFLKQVSDPHRFGVATVDAKGKVTEIVEKPRRPKSNFAVTGLYIFDSTVYEKMQDQQKSERGEYEISYLTNKYAEEKTLDAVHLKKIWFDVGTIDSLHEAGAYMHKKQNAKKRKK